MIRPSNWALRSDWSLSTEAMSTVTVARDRGAVDGHRARDLGGAPDGGGVLADQHLLDPVAHDRARAHRPRAGHLAPAGRRRDRAEAAEAEPVDAPGRVSLPGAGPSIRWM